MSSQVVDGGYYEDCVFMELDSAQIAKLLASKLKFEKLNQPEDAPQLFVRLEKSCFRCSNQIEVAGDDHVERKCSLTGKTTKQHCKNFELDESKWDETI